MAEKKLFLLDGHALVYRAHFAFINRPLINSKGVNTSAITGFTRTLWELLQVQNPTHIAVAFDPPTLTFRHEIYEAYKAQREEQPADIAVAMPYIQRIVQAFRIPIVSVDGYEADDVIGTLAKQAEKQGYQVYMVTPDKDFGQLVSDNVFIYKPSRQGNGAEVLGVAEVLEQWQIKRVDQVVDILGLQGDSVDNIPGIPGIGAKTAAKLLEEYDTVEGIIDNAESLSGKQKERILQYAEQGLLSKKLARIDVDVPIAFDAKQFEIEPFDREALSTLFKELEFRTLARQILGEDDTSAPTPRPSGQGSLFPDDPSEERASMEAPAYAIADKHIDNTLHTYHLVDTEEAREKLAELLSRQKQFCFDTETTSVDPNQAELVGLSFAVRPGEAYYLPVPAQADEARAVLTPFRPALEDPAIAKIAQNIKYDAIVLKWLDLRVRGEYLDTMVIHYLLEPDLRHNMDYLAETYLNYRPVPIEEVIGAKGKNQITMREAPLEKVKEYAAEDADITLQLYQYLAPRLREEGLEKLYRAIEGPLIKALVDMEFEGINIDVDFLGAYAGELANEIARFEQKIFQQVGFEFKINSPKQVGEVLFDKLKIPYRWGKTKTGQYSTNEEKLAELVGEHPIVEDILRYRGMTKLQSTYVEALPKMVNPRTGRIHSSFNQTIAATGRLSSNNPNLQNIPIRTPEGAKVREAFIPRDNEHLLLAADYSQIELRLIAEISGDQAMLDAFQKGQDIHRATAARVFETPYEAVSKEQRYRAKTVNFSIIYGAGATNLSRQLGIKRTEASELIEQYFRKYAGIKNYMEEKVREARDKGFVTTLMGRRRYLRDINSNSSLERGMAERMAINTPIQGTAADMIKIAMINIHQALEEGGFASKMILQVHDELVFDARRDEVDVIKPLIVEKMKTAIPSLKVPIEVEIGLGENWRDAH
jgi:DNA polymerase-1